MESLLRKYLWAIDLAVIGLCSIFLARAASSAVESKLVVPPPKAEPRYTQTSAAPSYSKEIEDTLKRNVFCSGCPPIIPVAEAAQTVDQQPPQRTSLPLSVMAILYSPPPMGIEWSLVIVRDTEEKSTGAYNVGAKLRTAVITEIEETRVYLDNGGKTEYLDLLDSTPSAPEAPVITASVPPPSPSASANDAFSQELDRGIKRLSDHKYEIQRTTLEAVLGNMNQLSRSARIVPEVRDGKNAGFRLYSVRPDGPFAKIGMQNGDVISSINGLEITSPEKALEVYAKLKSASHLSLGLERNGQKITKDYGIR